MRREWRLARTGNPIPQDGRSKAEASQNSHRQSLFRPPRLSLVLRKRGSKRRTRTQVKEHFGIEPVRKHLDGNGSPKADPAITRQLFHTPSALSYGEISCLEMLKGGIDLLVRLRKSNPTLNTNNCHRCAGRVVECAFGMSNATPGSHHSSHGRNLARCPRYNGAYLSVNKYVTVASPI